MKIQLPKKNNIILISQTQSNKGCITIFDGSNDQSTQIAKLSGNLGSFSISSTKNSLFVKFYSDGGLQWHYYTGFLATIQHGNPFLNFKQKSMVYSKSYNF